MVSAATPEMADRSRIVGDLRSDGVPDFARTLTRAFGIGLLCWRAGSPGASAARGSSRSRRRRDRGHAPRQGSGRRGGGDLAGRRGPLGAPAVRRARDPESVSRSSGCARLAVAVPIAIPACLQRSRSDRRRPSDPDRRVAARARAVARPLAERASTCPGSPPRRAAGAGTRGDSLRTSPCGRTSRRLLREQHSPRLWVAGRIASSAATRSATRPSGASSWPSSAGSRTRRAGASRSPARAPSAARLRRARVQVAPSATGCRALRVLAPGPADPEGAPVGLAARERRLPVRAAAPGEIGDELRTAPLAPVAGRWPERGSRWRWRCSHARTRSSRSPAAPRPDSRLPPARPSPACRVLLARRRRRGVPNGLMGS